MLLQTLLGDFAFDLIARLAVTDENDLQFRKLCRERLDRVGEERLRLLWAESPDAEESLVSVARGCDVPELPGSRWS